MYDSRSKINVVLPTAPKASRGYEDFADKIPNNPPYMAYLSNLPYDVTDDEIESFFSNLRISNMRIPREDRLGEVSRLRGFGYIEFEDRDSLIGALTIPDCVSFVLLGFAITMENCLCGFFKFEIFTSKQTNKKCVYL